MTNKSRFQTTTRAFTLVELLVSVSIFIFMTVLLVAKYGNFNQSVLLTNLAYDIALTLRTAQTYGLSVQGQGGQFQHAYGVDFCALSTASCSRPGESSVNNQTITLFVDNNNNGGYDIGDSLVSSYSIKRGAKILGFCTVTSGCNGIGGINTQSKRVHITFQRPEPDSIICPNFTNGNANTCLVGSPIMSERRQSYIKIVVQATDNSIRSIVVRRSGQISVED